MEIIGRQPSPRLLVAGLDEQSDFAEHLRKLAPTIRFVPRGLDLADSVRQGDWDAAVLWETDAPSLAHHLFVLQFGGSTTEIRSLGTQRIVIQNAGSTLSMEFIIPEGLVDDVSRLVRNELAPSAVERDECAVIQPRVISRAEGDKTPAPSDVWSPLLLDGDGKVLACRFSRSKVPKVAHTAEWWCLPDFAPSPEKWAAVAFANWRELAPTVFPGGSDWPERSEWQTPEERRLVGEHLALMADRDAARIRYESELSAIETEQAEEKVKVDQADRRLLTAQGPELVEEVIATLREIGFTVTDVDAEIAKAGDLREDIRLSEPSDPDWIAIGEIRGYAKGAQLNDLLRLGRFVRRYIKEEQREPDTVYYFVNQFLGSDPDTRPLPLSANPAEVETFGEDGGIVVHSKDLFTLKMRVRSGDLQPEDARALLRNAAGLLHLN